MTEPLPSSGRTFKIANLNHEHVLFQICKQLTPEQLDSVEDLRAWYEWEVNWRARPFEERKAILDREWRYD